MTDLIDVLPDFQTASFSHLLPSLTRKVITTTDLLSLDASEIAKRAQLPPTEVAKLSSAVLEALQAQLGSILPTAASIVSVNEDHKNGHRRRGWKTISTLDKSLDEALGGGIPTGFLTEVTGESGAGKTQFLLTLLLSVQLVPPHGLAKSAIYISTEAALSTSRLHQLLRLNPILSELPADAKPSLSRILSIQTPDLESQEHILKYQLPVAVKRQSIGLVVVDSIASNYRAEFDPNRKKDADKTGEIDELPEGKTMADRRSQLVQLGAYLRDLARSQDIAIIVSNQVADRMFPILYSQPTSTPGITQDPLALDHQMCWFTGWGDCRNDLSNLKTPSLGLVWANQISARIALIKAARSDREGKTRRWFRLVFAPWSAPTREGGIEYEITPAGVEAISRDDEESQKRRRIEAQDTIPE